MVVNCVNRQSVYAVDGFTLSPRGLFAAVMYLTCAAVDALELGEPKKNAALRAAFLSPGDQLSTLTKSTYVALHASLGVLELRSAVRARADECLRAVIELHRHLLGA